MIKQSIYYLTFLPLLVMPAACTKHESNCTYLSGQGYYCLQTTKMMQPFEAQQQIDISFKDHHEMMIAELEVDQLGLRFVGLTPFGQKLLQIYFDNHKAKIDFSATKMVDPTLLTAILQLTLWPSESIKQGLSPSLRLEEKDGKRLIYDQQTLILEALYTDKKMPLSGVHLTIPRADLILDIKSLNAPVVNTEMSHE